jgi:uncharacterized protein YneF (UPF0154 family)
MEGQTKPKKSKVLLIIVLILLFFVIGAVGGYFGYEYLTSQKVYEKLKDPEYISYLQEQQTEEILENLGSIILLPDEEPTMATLLDIEELKKENPEFYKDAQKGDYLVIYSEKAIIYREEENKVINVAPVYFEKSEENTNTDFSETNTENIEESASETETSEE